MSKAEEYRKDIDQRTERIVNHIEQREILSKMIELEQEQVKDLKKLIEMEEASNG